MKHIKKVLLLLTLTLVMVASVNLRQPAQASVGDTIRNTFPDTNFAQAVANKVAAGDIDAVLTQSMVDNCTTLTATYKNIQDISGVEVLTNLQTLSVYDNKLTSLPEGIGNLKNLQTLHIYNNQITSLPASIGNLTNLEVFHASNNNLTTLPDTFGDLVNLKTIYLVNNQLTALPDTFGNLVNLDTARITQNQLSRLPESMGNLSKVRELRFYENQIAALPDSIGGLTNLTLLDMGGNQLTSIPNSMGNLSLLNTLYLDNNLLPNGYEQTLNSLGLSLTVAPEVQRQLTLDPGVTPYVINKGTDLDAIYLYDIVGLNDSAPVSYGHTLILEDYIDGNGNPVALTDYIENGIVKKNGTIYPTVRATGTGLFPNNSEHAVTVDRIALVFQATYYELSFDLNGGEGTAPETQTLLEGQVGIPVEAPTRDGFAFTGWNTQADGNGMNWIPDVMPMFSQNMTLFAQWEEAGDQVLPPSPPTPTPTPEQGITTGNNGGTNMAALYKVGTSSVPQTGDVSTVGILLVILMGSLAGLSGLIYKRKRTNK